MAKETNSLGVSAASLVSSAGVFGGMAGFVATSSPLWLLLLPAGFLAALILATGGSYAAEMVKEYKAVKERGRIERDIREELK